MNLPEAIFIEVLNNTVYLDNKCWCCDGKGEVTVEDVVNLKKSFRREICDICKGKGYVMTDQGQAIINLVKRYS